MGCSICMDDFEEAEDGQRPTALPCGHIFHFTCVQSWFYGSTAASTSLPNKQRCPLCAKPTNPKTMMRLYPSEGNDLDKYLQACHWTQGEDAASAMAAAKSADARNKARARDMLNSLMDLNTSLQSFVMSAHNIRVTSMVKAGVKIKKLVQDLRPEGDDAELLDLNRAIVSLTRVASSYDDMKKEVEKEQARVNKRMSAIDALELQAAQLLSEATRKEAHAKTLMDGASKKLKAAEDAQHMCKTQSENLERRAAHADLVDAELRSRQRALEQERKQEAFNTSIKIGVVETKSREEISAMQAKVALAEEQCREAEHQRRMTKEKNNLLAEQMREMKERFKQSKTAGSTPAKGAGSPGTAATPAPPTPSVGSAATIRKQAAEIQSLKQQLKRLQSRDSVPKQTTKSREFIIDLTGSRSPSPEKDGREQAQKRARRSTLLIEPETFNDDSDDDTFPMPGLAHASRPAREPLLTTHTNTASPADAQFLDRISSKNGVVLGRKRRPPL